MIIAIVCKVRRLHVNRSVNGKSSPLIFFTFYALMRGVKTDSEMCALARQLKLQSKHITISDALNKFVILRFL